VVDGSRVYLDASAIVKLVLPEPETPALRTYLESAATILCSRLAHVEVRRAVARIARPGDKEHTDELFEGVRTIELDAAIGDVAASVGPPTLRSLDAVHLASALAVGEELDSLVTYDLRLADAAQAAGLTVVAPA
jgi:uncharacterized protein